MSARPVGGALTAGLILIAIGTIFLIENLSSDFSAWRILARYWPLILIIVGLRRIYDYFTWPEIPPAPTQAEPKE